MILAEMIIKQLAPFDCLFCGQEGEIVCHACLSRVMQPVASRCYRCHAATAQFSTCHTCARRTPLKHVWVATELKETSKKLLYTYKFERAQAAAKTIAAVMYGALSKINPDTCIVPVPTATSRTRQRGYDHAALLAREISTQTGLHYHKMLIRLTQTRQVGSTRTLRLNQLQGAFRVRRPQAVIGKHVLLVDDVLTTGASAEEAARQLLASGALSVSAVVFAQKMAVR